MDVDSTSGDLGSASSRALDELARRIPACEPAVHEARKLLAALNDDTRGAVHLVVAPPASGKSVLTSALVEDWLEANPDRRVELVNPHTLRRQRSQTPGSFDALVAASVSAGLVVVADFPLWAEAGAAVEGIKSIVANRAELARPTIWVNATETPQWLNRYAGTTIALPAP
jgi:hypothetical protein